MKKQSGLILPLLIIVVLALGAFGYFYLGIGKDQVNQLISQEPAGGKTEVQPTSPAQILITPTGFIPATITVAKGQQITWVNNDSKNHQIISQKLALDSEPLSQNDSFGFSFENSGTFSYLDNLNKTKFKGEIIVK